MNSNLIYICPKLLTRCRQLGGLNESLYLINVAGIRVFIWKQVLHLNCNGTEPIYFHLTIQITFPQYEAGRLFCRQERFVLIVSSEV